VRIRSTERSHDFTRRLFTSLDIFNLGGLTIGDNSEFTACIEALELDESERLNFRGATTLTELEAKFHLSRALNVPFLFLVYQAGEVIIYQVMKNGEFHFKTNDKIRLEELPQWWRSVKRTRQPKPIYEASSRITNSVFDNTLANAGLAWGGNIDGFLFSDARILAIVENIYTQKNPLHSSKADPATYFKSKGPNYNSWLPSVLLANRLGVPLFLFTFEGNSSEERMGFTVIDHLGSDGIYYRGGPPNKNILDGLDTIKATVLENLIQSPPWRDER
jgi:hypothetical protein